MTIELTRSALVYKIGEKSISIDGEAYRPDDEEPYFVLYTNTIIKWDKPFENIKIGPEDKEAIVNAILKDAAAQGIKVVVE